MQSVRMNWKVSGQSKKCPYYLENVYLDHAYAQNLAKPPFMRICHEFENWRDLRALSGKYLQKKFAIQKVFAFCDSECMILKFLRE